MQRLSTGQRINAAKDDAAGMQSSTRLKSEIKSLEQSTKNATDAQSLLKTAEGSMSMSTFLLQRVRELAMKSANGTMSVQDRIVLDNEAQALLKENDGIVNQTLWGRTKILDGTFFNKNVMIGTNTSLKDQFSISIPNILFSSLATNELKYSINGTVANSDHPGQNNSNDVTVHGFRPGSDIENYIQLNPDTTNGMNASMSTTSIDSTLDVETKVEILGIEYTLDPGTTEEKNEQLSQYLSADGISNSIGTDGNGLEIVLVESKTLRDYALAYGSDVFEIHADPLNNSDGKSNDALWPRDSLTFNTNYSVPSLVAGYTKPRVSTLRPSITVTTPEKVGSEFQVNSYTAGDQNGTIIPPQSVAALSNGDFVISWNSAGQDGSDAGIYAQIFSSNGTKKGSEFLVNSITENNQLHPTVSAFDDGGFIIGFMSYGQDGDSAGHTNSYAQRFDSAGNRVGEQFILTDNTAGYQHHPVVTALSDGKFVATWQANATNQYKIYSKIFDSNNNPLSAEFMVNTSTSGMQHHADTAKLSNGDFVVSWVDTGQQSTGVYGQRFDASGNKLGSEFQINTYTTLDQQEPAVTALKDGGFVVTWQSNGQDDDSYGIFGQRYDASGTAAGDEFQVNTTVTDSQEFSTGVGLRDGGFLIAWTSNMQDGSGYGVYAQRYDSRSEKVGNEFRINSYTNNNQDRVSLTQLMNGNVVAMWDSEGQDGDGDGVFAQILDVGPSLDISTAGGSVAALDIIDLALNNLNSHRTSVGVLARRLDYKIAVNIDLSVELSKASSLTQDTDYAKETAELAKNNVLQRASMHAQVLSKNTSDTIRTLLSGDSFVHKQNFLY